MGLSGVLRNNMSDTDSFKGAVGSRPTRFAFSPPSSLATRRNFAVKYAAKQGPLSKPLIWLLRERAITVAGE
jgi:hypothetical protein